MAEVMPLLSVIIPVFNEEKTVGEVIKKVLAVPISKEIIVVDDGSTDETAKVLAMESQNIGDGLRIHTCVTNCGKGAAVRLGYSLARGQLVIIQDADLELDPAEYPKLLEPIIAGHTEVVHGSRYLGSNKVSTINRIGNSLITNFFNVLFDARLTDLSTCFKVMRGNLAKSLALKSTGFEIEPEITVKLAKRGIKIFEIPISYIPRSGGGKKIKYFKDGVKYVLTIVRFYFEA